MFQAKGNDVSLVDQRSIRGHHQPKMGDQVHCGLKVQRAQLGPIRMAH